jgi:hypothetical protein
MKVRHAFTLGIFALAATSAVFAAVPLNGEGATRGDQGSAGPSQTTRAAVKADELQARADGMLVGPGSNSPGGVVYQRLVAAPSTVTRGEVKSEVLEARAEGALAPAGEAAGFFDGQGANVQMARHFGPAHEVFAARTAK